MTIILDGETPKESSLRKNKKVIRKTKKKPKPPKRHNTNGSVKKKTGRKLDPAIDERRQQAIELHTSGVSYRDIAKQLNYHDGSHARRDVLKALENIELDAAKSVVIMDLALMDEFKMRCLHKLRTDGDLHQIDRIMRVMDFKYRLLGVTDETVRELQAQHGVATNITHNKNSVMVINAAPETETEFIDKMMRAVGVDPESQEAQEFMRQKNQEAARTLPLLAGSANETKNVGASSTHIEDEDIVDAVIVE